MSAPASVPRREVAFATYGGLPALSADDRLLVPALDALGVRVVPCVWSDPSVDWSRYAAVVVRSCWDYHLRLAEFLAWVDGLEHAGIAVWNAPALIRWNADKSYLRTLETRGVRVVPTAWVEAGSDERLRDVQQARGWHRVVVKPAISASAHDTWIAGDGEHTSDDARFRALEQRGVVMVQPFMPEIQSAGEWSLVFVGNAFSHAVLKRPRDGDFRVQEEHGGQSRAVAPPASLVVAAQAALAAVPAGPRLYARVDGCVVDGAFVLMELELIEPSLFFATDFGAASRFADALVKRLRPGHTS